MTVFTGSKQKGEVVALCLISVLFHTTPLWPLAVAQGQNSNPLRYEIDDVFVGSLRHVINIENPTHYKLGDGELYVPIIRNETNRHYVILNNISSPAGQPTFLSDDSGNEYAYWGNITIDRKQTFNAEINYYVLSFSIRYSIDPSLIADYNRSSDLYRKYTQPEELIQSGNPKIISKAQSLTSDEDNVHAKVSKIYNFVVTHMRYAAQDDERGALWALENGVGDCSEYSYLFAALCRAAEIPARVQAGFAFQFSMETSEEGHMWAEYYLENYGWIPVDATWRLVDTIDHRHFSSIQSVPEVISYSNYAFNYSSGPEEVDEKQSVSIKPCSPQVFGESFPGDARETAARMKQARLALYIGKIFGAALIFKPETQNVEQTLLEAQIQLQSGISFWETYPQVAQSYIADALESAGEASHCAWMLVVKTYVLYIGTTTIIMLIALFFMKRHESRKSINDGSR